MKPDRLDAKEIAGAFDELGLVGAVPMTVFASLFVVGGAACAGVPVLGVGGAVVSGFGLFAFALMCFGGNARRGWRWSVPGLLAGWGAVASLGVAQVFTWAAVTSQAAWALAGALVATLASSALAYAWARLKWLDGWPAAAFVPVVLVLASAAACGTVAALAPD